MLAELMEMVTVWMHRVMVLERQNDQLRRTNKRLMMRVRILEQDR